MLIEKRAFGRNSKGEAATVFCFENKNGMRMEVSDFGATLRTLLVPDGNENFVDVVLGYDDPAGYEGPGRTFFGATVGRNANRIGGARFTLNEKEYQLDANDGANNLHSGFDFYNYRIWQVKGIEDNSITFSLHSPHGDQGYPGALDLDVTYTLREDNAVQIDYLGLPDEDTVINVTNHSYFNLNGHDSGSIEQHVLWLDADYFTRTNAQLIPTGELVPVDGTPMDFRTAKAVGRDINQPYEALIYGKGYDHNWCLNNAGKFSKVARLTGDQSGITMEVYTDLPGVQIYSDNNPLEEPCKQGIVHSFRQGICFETQFYPDAPNHKNFPSSVCPGGTQFKSTTVYKFL